jgi:tRNA(Ile)-lysidine synthase
MLLTKVHNAILDNRMLQSGDRILVAVSGGPDSVSLCHLLHRLRHILHVELIVGHVHHGLRGEEADADASFVEDFANQLELPVSVTQVNVSSWRKRHGGSLQMAARAVRYQCLRQIMDDTGASKLALGHNADDQAEEVLLRLFRGAGQRGLTGMPACSRDGLIRPLLECYRHEIIAYLENHALAYRQDSSNVKPGCLRNLLRLEVLPSLQESFNHRIIPTLLRTSKILKEEDEFWESLAKSWLNRHSSEQDSGGLSLPITLLLKTHPAMQRRLLRRVVELVRGDLKGIGFKHTESLMRLCRSSAASSQIDLPGALVAEKDYDWLTVTRPHEMVMDFFYEIPGPGIHQLPLLNHHMELRFLAAAARPQFSHEPGAAIMDRDRVSLPIFLRRRKPGDRFRPLGLGGSKKVKDFFIDLKVPKSQRPQIPILCSKDHILWIVGHRLDDRVKVTSSTKRTIYLHYRQEADIK